MKLVADEGVDRPVVERLRQDGHRVICVAELSPGATDDEVLNCLERSASSPGPRSAEAVTMWGRVPETRLVFSVLCAMLLAALAFPPVAAAQQDRGDAGARERAFIDQLRREDPAMAERFIALRDARDKALADLQTSERLVGTMPAELRASFIPQLTQAWRKYVDAQMHILDFLDERDRRLIARLREDIEQLTRDLEAHQRSRDELRKLVPE